MAKRNRKGRSAWAARKVSNRSTPPPFPIADEPLLAEALALTGAARDVRLAEVSDVLRARMEADASRLKDLVLAQPPQDLLAYLWSMLHMKAMYDSERPYRSEPDEEAEADVVRATLEYVHAIWSSFPRQTAQEHALDEAEVGETVEVVRRLRHTALCHSIAASSRADNGEFGGATGFVEFNARSSWVLIRGNRYQVLEGEFFAFVLRPHDAALREAYGIGADEVAKGVQAIATSMREGFTDAADRLESHMNVTHLLADERGFSIDQALAELATVDPRRMEDLAGSMQDLLFGGLCNLSRHTSLPPTLLEDLAYQRAENSEFFAPGPFCGTPLRTLPGRVKPLIRLENEFYATDGHFVRDAAYRAIERGLCVRIPRYRQEWNNRQKAFTESAFQRLFSKQLDGARILTGVYYRDVSTGQWTEADTVIELDDVLIQVEAKAGVGAMHSPATHFSSHVRAIQNLIVKAHDQTQRFFEYLASAAEVPLYERLDGDYVEVHRLSLSRFRLALPIGLTVESFSPFSAMCKEMPSVLPILGVHPFVSMSIDDLFVLNKFLPSAGDLFHYLEVRQRVAGIRGARLFDEFDHLGAYIEKNRFDIDLRSQLATSDMVAWDGFSAPVDAYFSGDRWRNESPPRQHFPVVLQEILDLLGLSHTPGWLAVNATIRDLNDFDRADLAKRLRGVAASLPHRSHRWFVKSGDGVRTLLFWVFRHGELAADEGVIRQAELSALATGVAETWVVCASATVDCKFTSARAIKVPAPSAARENYDTLRREADALKAGSSYIPQPLSGRTAGQVKLGRNDPCWCGNGKKFKRCHGR